MPDLYVSGDELNPCPALRGAWIRWKRPSITSPRAFLASTWEGVRLLAPHSTAFWMDEEALDTDALSRPGSSSTKAIPEPTKRSRAFLPSGPFKASVPGQT